MPMNPAVLGPACIVASGTSDPIGIAGWMAIASGIVVWTLGNVILNPVGGTPLVAVGPVILGTGALVVPPALPLGALLAVASLAPTPAGIAKWTAVANEYASWLATCQCNPQTFIAFVNPLVPMGPVGGVGTIIPGPKKAPDFAKALELTDAAGKARWTAVGEAVAACVQTALITPSALQNPGVGGLAVGSVTIT